MLSFSNAPAWPRRCASYQALYYGNCHSPCAVKLSLTLSGGMFSVKPSIGSEMVVPDMIMMVKVNVRFVQGHHWRWRERRRRGQYQKPWNSRLVLQCRVKCYLSCFQLQISFRLLFVRDEIATYSQNRFSLRLLTDVKADCKRIHCSYRNPTIHIYSEQQVEKRPACKETAPVCSDADTTVIGVQWTRAANASFIILDFVQRVILCYTGKMLEKNMQCIGTNLVKSCTKGRVILNAALFNAFLPIQL